MSRSSEILIGLNAGPSVVRVIAFDGAGRELESAEASAPVERGADGAVGQDLAETWQAAVLALRRLAEKLPDLAGRTVALGLTGQGGGTFLIDEDGDPVAPAWLGLDRRALPVVGAWQRHGVLRAVHEITGSPITASMRSAQLAWLLRQRPEVVAHAATACQAKDWLYLCCTGERATDPAEAVATFGDVRTGAYEGRVLELLGLREIAPLLPDMVDGTTRHGVLGAAAASAVGLRPGTPVALGPFDLLAAGLAAGLHEPGAGVACSILDAGGAHMQSRAALDTAGVADRPVGIAALPGGGFVRMISPAAGAPCIDWLAGLCAQLLADAGLIGFPRAELVAMLDRKAAEAAPGALRFQPFAAEDGSPPVAARGKLLGLSERTTPYDLMRAVYEGIGLSARDGHAAFGEQPSEIRLVGEPGRSAAFAKIFAACAGAPVRPLKRSDPAAAGAALLAAVSIGHYRSPAEALIDWVEPHLGAPVPVDPELGRLCERRTEKPD